MIEDGLYSDVVVVPLSSKLKNNDFTLTIKKRDNLHKDSTLLCNAVKMINVKRLMLEEGSLTVLTTKEVEQVESIFHHLFDLGCNG